VTVSSSDALDLLRHGEMELEGRLVDASNTTLRAVITHCGVTARGVYKPVRGERPLWDFPDGTLADREVAAYQVSVSAGWDLVPPTVLRDDAPLGPGMCQLWIDPPEDEQEQVVGFLPGYELPPGWHRVAAARGTDGTRYLLAHAEDARLVRMALFDAVVNNADRKGGHVIPADGGRLYGVDHGICFHVEDKLRTILWGWAGDRLPRDATETLRKLRAELDGALGRVLSAHLTGAEVAAVVARVDRLIASGRFPVPSQDWPAIPWPPV
jgi:uncharacterized repeat protein (TIGR03843 family)